MGGEGAECVERAEGGVNSSEWFNRRTEKGAEVGGRKQKRSEFSGQGRKKRSEVSGQGSVFGFESDR